MVRFIFLNLDKYLETEYFCRSFCSSSLALLAWFEGTNSLLMAVSNSIHVLGTILDDIQLYHQTDAVTFKYEEANRMRVSPEIMALVC